MRRAHIAIGGGRRLGPGRPGFRLGAGAASLALMAGWAAGSSVDDPERGVVRVRRDGPGAGGTVYSARRAAERGERDASDGGDGGGAGAASGAMLAASGQGSAGMVDGGPELNDPDPERPGLPDAVAGEPGPDGEARPEAIVLRDIRVRGERVGRFVRFVGAELVFADRAMDASHGTPIGFNGVMGSVGPNTGSAPLIEFELPTGGEITLRVQAAAVNPNAPARLERTVTLQVP